MQHAPVRHKPEEAVDSDGVCVILDDAVVDGCGGFKEHAGDVGMAFEWEGADEIDGDESAEAMEIAIVRTVTAWKHAGVKGGCGFGGARDWDERQWDCYPEESSLQVLSFTEMNEAQDLRFAIRSTLALASLGLPWGNRRTRSRSDRSHSDRAGPVMNLELCRRPSRRMN